MKYVAYRVYHFIHQNRLHWWFLTLLCVCLIVYYKIPIRQPHESIKPKLVKNNSHICQFPTNPWDPSVLEYLSDPDPIECDPVQSNVTYFDNGTIKVNQDFRGRIKCLYRYFGHKPDSQDREVIYGEWKNLDTELRPEKNFMQVNCSSGSNETFYHRYYTTIVARKTNLYNRTIEDTSVDRPSVVMFGIDSMSRNNFIRRLPKTYAFLNSSGFVDMKRHVKIGDNTFPNTLGILTGEVDRRDYRVYFDDYPFVWNDYSKQNYATFYAEDIEMGTFTSYPSNKGFRNEPVDYYMRPFWLAAIYDEKLMPRNRCYDGEPSIIHHLNSLGDFILKYEGKRKFAYWFAADISHDSLNNVGAYDPYFLDFFQRNEKHFFDDSIIIVFGDHGFRMGGIRNTFIGRLEVSTPVLMIRLPEKLKAEYPHLMESLQYNSELMTTHFDLHSTLKQIVDSRFNYTEKDMTKQKYSLFGPVPTNRTCQKAKIPDTYCPCVQEKEISIEDAKKASDVLLAYINSLLNEYNQSEMAREYLCEHMELDEIKRASMFTMNDKFLLREYEDNQTLDGIEHSYRVVFQAKKPCHALIEGVVKHNLEKDEWLPSGEVDRINLYGNTSHCVFHNSTLKKLCHCTKRFNGW